MYEIKGFSLMELMIVLAILGILSTLALPNYRHYMQKARFTEIILAAEPFKMAITLNLQSGYSPNDIHDGSANLPPIPPATKNLASLKIENAIITLTSTHLAGDLNYILKPNNDGSQWTVSGSCVKAGVCETS